MAPENLERAKDVEIAERIVDDQFRALTIKVLSSKLETPVLLLLRDVLQLLENSADKAEDAADAATYGFIDHVSSPSLCLKPKLNSSKTFLWSGTPQEGSQLYKTAYYGKPFGIAKPKIPEFDVPLVLDFMEGLYLAETEQIVVYENPNETKVGLKKLRIKAKQLYDEFEEKYAVYRDLRGTGLIVTPGIKFGVDFAVYKYGPGVEHAPYMVTVKKAGGGRFRDGNREERQVGDDGAQTLHFCCARFSF